MRSIPIFDAKEEGTHMPTDNDPSFQESALFAWYDLKSGLGGFWRIGQEAVAGALNSCFGMFTADGLRFRSNVTGVPMAAADRGETHMGWGKVLRADLSQLAIKADFPDCEASLKFSDFHPRYHHYPLVNIPVSTEQHGHHFECSGRMTGRVRVGNSELEVDALAYRDRSWGPRRWGTMRATRWWPFVFGPDLCGNILAVVDESGYRGCRGYIIRDGVPYAVAEGDVAVTLDYDAIGPRSGYAPFVLENGEKMELHHERKDGIVLHVRGYTAVESIGLARWGDRVGMSDLEVCTNPTGGTKPPVMTLNANNGDGLSRR
jgi:hypothetical protein